MKEDKIASIVYYIVIALSVVVFGVFFCVGFGNMESLPSGYYSSPANTDLLMYWMYALVVICAVCTIAGAVLAKGGKVDSNMPTWGKVLAQIGLWLFVPVLVVAWFLGSPDPIMIGTGLFDDALSLQATDAMIYAIYTMLVVMVVALIVSLLGIFKKLS